MQDQHTQETTRSRWHSFLSLEWFDGILDFLFALTAKSSEVLLAAGVILSTANHFQHGNLFTTTVIEQGQPVVTDTPLFEVWTWTQAIGFEASAGVVLAMALDAQRHRDQAKRNVLLMLMVGLAFVGTTMLVMAFVEAATGFKERDLPAAYGITMSILRGVVSVAYVTVGRVKNRRFSGPEVVPMTAVPDLMTQMAQMSTLLQQTTTALEQRLSHMETKTTQQIQALRTHLDQTAKTLREDVQGSQKETTDYMEHLGLTTHQSLLDLRASFRQEMQETLSIHLVPVTQMLEDAGQGLAMLPALTRSLGKIEDTTTAHLRTVVEEVTQVKTTLQARHPVPRIARRMESRDQVNGSGKESSVATTTLEAISTTQGQAFEKGAFVRQCLHDDPGIRNADIQRKAALLGQTISPGYISDIRKAFAEPVLHSRASDDSLSDIVLPH